MSDFSFVDDEIALLEKSLLLRDEKVLITPAGPWSETVDGKRFLQFASNNYLGLANHPDLMNSSKCFTGKYGFGSSGSRLLSGTSELHSNVEAKLAEFQKADACVFFSSGYLANIGLITSLTSKDDLIFSDELNHASVIDAIRLSKAKKVIYNHLDLEDLETKLQEYEGKYRKAFVISNSVFSMSGDMVNLHKLSEIVKKYDCIPILDEAHAVGVYGDDGAGLVCKEALQDTFKIRIATCSKAFGAEGGFVVAPHNVAKLMKSKARSYIFSTSPTLSSMGAIMKSIEFIQDGNWRREKLWNNVNALYSGLKKISSLNIKDLKTQHIIIEFDSIEKCLTYSNRLLEECHVWAPAIRPPTVKAPIIRLTPISTHSEEDINFVIKAFRFLADDVKLVAANMT